MVGLAYAAAAPPDGGGAGGVMTQLLFFGAIFAIFYFLLIRPQQKQRRDRERMLGTVKKGDRVVMSSGMHGTVVALNDHVISVKIADQVRVDFDRSAVARIVAPSEKDASS